jgi:hypothetical protein
MVYPQAIGVDNVTTSNTIVRLYLNPSVSGAAYTGVLNTNSVINYDAAGTGVAGGTLLATYYVAAQTQTFINFEDLNIVLAPGDILVVGAQNTNGGTVTEYFSLTWIEGF